jgi:acetyl-CoA synthetase
MRSDDRLPAADLVDREWESYEELEAALPFPVPLEVNLASYLCDRWAEDDERRVAIHADGADRDPESIRYADLAARADALAAHLADRGVDPGDRVGLILPQRPETVVAHLAAWKLGAVSVPLSTLFGTDAVKYRLSDSESVACVVDESNLETFRSVRGDLDALESAVTVGVPRPRDDETVLSAVVRREGQRVRPHATAAEDPSVILYTSGSTGDPKGVVLSHEMFLGYLPTFVAYACNMTVADDNCHWTPAEWAWSGSLYTTVFPPLFFGKSIVSYAAGKFQPSVAFELIERYELTNTHLPPTALRMMQEVEDPGDRYDLSSLRVISTGGDTVDPDLVTWAEGVFGDVVVHSGYGQTEMLAVTNDCVRFFEPREGSVGRKAPGHEVAILDPDTHEPLDDTGTIGEFGVRYEGDPVAFTEYWDEPEKTNRKVRDGWLLTEDLGWVDEDGYYYFKARKDDVIISAGYRIGPEEIETVLEDHPSVREAAVIGIPDDERGEVPKAVLVLAEGASLDVDLEADLESYVRDRLAQYEYPRAFEAVAELPKTVTGKKQRSILEERERDE